MASQDWIDKDFYAILGVPHDADDPAIKKAYRKQARTMHPDQNANDPKAEARFKEVSEAYSVLSDPKERREYDQIRAMTRGGARFTAGGPDAGGFEDLFSGMFGGGAGSTGGGPGVRFDTGGRTSDADLQDLLGGLFGPGAGAGSPYGGYRAPHGPRRGADVNASVTLGFREAVSGDTVTLTTSDGGRLTTRIPAGVKDGQKIRLRGKGRPGDHGSEPGDLLLTVSVTPHPLFGRDGDNLTLDVPVTFAEAALGATIAIPTLSGEKVRVKVPAGTPSGRVLRVKGRGVTTSKAKGDLLAKVQIVVPQRLTEAARTAMETLQAEDAGHDPRADLFARAAQ